MCTRRALTATSALAILALPACSAGDEPVTEAVTVPSPVMTAPAAEDGDWLAYTAAEGDVSRVFLLGADGTRTVLARDIGVGDQTNPDWSPDGERLVFAAGNGMTEDLWVADADGTDGYVLLPCTAPCVALDDPAWSPDGTSVVFTRLSHGDGSVGIGSLEQVDVATGELTVLAPAPNSDFFAGARVSPDGTRVVLELVHTDGSAPFDGVTGVELAVVDLTTDPATITPITDAAAFAATADWMPDGSAIVFAALPAADVDASELFSIAPDGTGLTRLTHVTDAQGSAEHPDVTEDGTGIVFAGSTAGGDRTLLRLDLATGAVESVAPTGDVAGSHPRTRPAP